MWLLIVVVVVVDFFAIRHILGKDKKRPDPAPEELVDQGGLVGNTVTKRTRYLVRGKNSGVLKNDQANEAKAAGQDITILSPEDSMTKVCL